MRSDPGVSEEQFVELHPRARQCGGLAAQGPWGSTRRPFDDRRGPVIGIVVDARSWRELGSPLSEKAFWEALAVQSKGGRG